MDTGNNVNDASFWNVMPLSPAIVIALYNPRVAGLKSACGVVVGEITGHAAERIVERGVTLAILVDLIKNAPMTYPDRKPHRVCQQKENRKIVLDRNTGDIVTVVDLDG